MVPQKTELTEKLMKQIYDLSAGIPSYIVKIFQEAQVQAILTVKCYTNVVTVVANKI